MNRAYFSPSGDGWRNLALDEYLLNTWTPEGVFLLLYVNDNAVILGRNQNPWAECELARMRAEGVQLVRRCSGGAVYQDKGNLNYSFIAPADCYDEVRQAGVILGALADLGIQAEVSGRNDLTAAGRKISGTAFCRRGGRVQHHGTLLIHTDLARMARYLTASPLKLRAKGVASVRSRVCNLQELCPELTVEAAAAAILARFQREYGDYAPYSPDEKDLAEVEKLYTRNRSWAWQLGEAPAFDFTLEGRCSWGTASLCLKVCSGYIREAVLFTDALDTALPEAAAELLRGTPFSPEAVRARLSRDVRLAELAEEL